MGEGDEVEPGPQGPAVELEGLASEFLLMLSVNSPEEFAALVDEESQPHSVELLEGGARSLLQEALDWLLVTLPELDRRQGCMFHVGVEIHSELTHADEDSVESLEGAVRNLSLFLDHVPVYVNNVVEGIRNAERRGQASLQALRRCHREMIEQLIGPV